MYSVVLLMALSTAVETPDRCGRCGCGCRCGCYSGCGCGCYGCHSYCGCGCYGCGCYGCGCSYGCYSCGYSYGCCGYGYGCGSYGCCGYSYGCCGGYSCGYGYGYGCCGGYSCGYGCAIAAPAVVAPAAPAPMAPAPAGKVGSAASTAATIVVSLPADAKLTVDDHLTTSTSASRLFTSPSLPVGQDYSYTLKAEIVREGKTLTASERITVRAGADVRVELPASKFAAATVASK